MDCCDEDPKDQSVEPAIDKSDCEGAPELVALDQPEPPQQGKAKEPLEHAKGDENVREIHLLECQPRLLRKIEAKAARGARAKDVGSDVWSVKPFVVDEGHGDTVGGYRSEPEQIESAEFGRDAALGRFDPAVFEVPGG